jgi:hypothetical protein
MLDTVMVSLFINVADKLTVGAFEYNEWTAILMFKQIRVATHFLASLLFVNTKEPYLSK